MQALCARCVTLLLKWMVRTIALDVLFQLFLTNALVIIKCNTTGGIISYNQAIELTCNAYNIPNAVYNWTSTEFKQPRIGASVTVIATNDSVEYNCTATSDDDVKQLGSIYVFSIDDDICWSSKAIPVAEVVQGSSNKTSVEGRMLTFSCEFKGRYSLNVDYGFKWMITFQNGTSKVVKKNDNSSDYSIYIQQMFRDCHCYYLRTELYVLATTSLDKARITCSTEHLSGANSSSYLSIIELPRLISGPTDAIGVKEHERVTFECRFSGSLIQYLAICEWLKDGDPASTENKHQFTDSKYIICSYSIKSVSSHDEGKYDCYLYYNPSFGNEYNFPKDEIIKSKSEGAVLQLAKDVNTLGMIIVTIFVVLGVLACLIAMFLYSVSRKNPVKPPKKEDDKASLLTAAQSYRTIPTENAETPTLTVQVNEAQNVEGITPEVYDTIHPQTPVDDTSSNDSYEDATDQGTISQDSEGSKEELLSSAEEDDTSSNESYQDAIDQGTISQDSEGSKEELLSSAEEGQEVDCADANKYIKSEYVGLSRINISDEVLGRLYARNVITHDEQIDMNHLGIEKRMKFLLDKVIIPSLLTGHGEKYINLIHVMKHSEDTSLNAQAPKLKCYVRHR